MTTRCKFVLTERTEFEGGQVKLVFQARYDDAIPEDQRFCRWTPTGRVEMAVSPDSTAAQLKVGQAYYFDCSPVPEPESAPTPVAVAASKGQA